MSAGNVRGSHGCDGLVIGGTTEARLVIDALNRAGFSLTVCVATELGKNVLSDVYGIFQTKICVGRKDQKGFEEILGSCRPQFVVDASHPFAVEVSKNIKNASDRLGIPCLRYVRGVQAAGDHYIYVRDVLEAAAVLREMSGNILLTTGANTASIYARELKDFNERVYIRVLDTPASVEQCKKAGICQSHIIAAAPPFTVEDNLRLIDSRHIKVLVTKDSGAAGGVKEKLQSADIAGIKAVIIKRPGENDGQPSADCIEKLMAWINA